jgi:hypothetical protein
MGEDESRLRMMAEDKGLTWDLSANDQKAIRSVLQSLAFYRRRCEALQAYQRELPEPHRTAICNILANGQATASGGSKN